MIIKFFKKKIYTFLAIIFVSLLLTEIFAKLLVKVGYLDKGLPAWVTLRAHQDFGTWHPKRSSFIIEKKNCWISRTSYNSLGMRKTFNFKINNENKNQEKIALLGDSMVENIEVEDGLDLGSSIQKKIGPYQVLNFGSRGTGLADQTEIYKKLIKPKNVDYLFLFVTENDIYNNVNGFTSGYHKRFEYVDNRIVEIPKDQNYLNNYNSFKKKFFRENLLFLKKFDFYKVYLKYHSAMSKQKKETVKQNLTDKFDLTDSKKKIYIEIKKKFINALDKNTKLFVFLNARPHIFNPDKDAFTSSEHQVTNFLKKIWEQEDKFFDPYTFVKKELVENNKFSFPYLSFECDSHYSSFGSNIYAKFVSESFLNNK